MDLCPRYHENYDDKRRPSSSLPYRMQLCRNMYTLGKCAYGKCGFAHTDYEIIFHLDNYKTQICKHCLEGYIVMGMKDDFCP